MTMESQEDAAHVKATRLLQEVRRRQSLVDAARKDWGPYSLRSKLTLVLPIFAAAVAACLPWAKWLNRDSFGFTYPVFMLAFLTIGAWTIAWGAMRKAVAVVAILDRCRVLDDFIDAAGAGVEPSVHFRGATPDVNARRADVGGGDST